MASPISSWASLCGLPVSWWITSASCAHPPGEHSTPLREHNLSAVEAQAGPPGDGFAGPGDRGLDRGRVVDGVYGDHVAGDGVEGLQLSWV